MNFVRSFVAIVGGALGSSALGGVFGSVVAVVSPEFVKTLASAPLTESPVRYAAGLGMIWGLFLGTAVMAFSILIATLIRLTKALAAKEPPNGSP